MNRRLRISGVVVCALSLGVWIGASWHAASSNLAGGSSCCRMLAQVQPCYCARLSAHPRFAAKAAAKVEVCAACLTGVLTQDAPVSIDFARPAVVRAGDLAPRVVVQTILEIAQPLPPQTGPPV